MWDKYGRSGCGTTTTLSSHIEIKKEGVLLLILEKGVPLSHIRIDYRICKTALQRWVSSVRKYGYEALKSKKCQERPAKYTMGRPKKKEPQTELESLQA